LTIRRRS